VTILGAVALDGETALAWTDSAIFSASASAPIGHASKLSVNALACIAGVGAGWDAVAVEGANALAASLGLDELVEELPAKLRRVAFRVAPVMEKLDPGSFATCMFAAVGWSRQCGRMLVFEFAAASAFEARPTTCVTVPELPPLIVPNTADWFAVACAAEHQMREFRRRRPEADGQLVAAVLRPGSIQAGVLLNFAAGAPATPTADQWGGAGGFGGWLLLGSGVVVSSSRNQAGDEGA
jgi:hypothetical protein